MAWGFVFIAGFGFDEGMRTRRLALVVTVLMAMTMAACGTDDGVAEPTPSPTPDETASPTPEASPEPDPMPEPTPEPEPEPAEPDPIADWTLEQQVGALFMVGAPVGGVSDLTMYLVTERHAGGIFLHGRSSVGTQVIAEMVATYADAATTPVPLLVATDQEGGNVQVLSGPGFSQMPTATRQATDPQLAASAAAWGQELRAAGVNVNFAPVADLVAPAYLTVNDPITRWYRHFGTTFDEVFAGAEAFAAGMQAGGVAPTLKHFPGLGRVVGNPDFVTGVTDTATTADDEMVIIFLDLLAALDGATPAPWVMMSTAVYALIDPDEPAAFSPVVVGLLRDAGFEGIVVTDDLAAARQVAAWSPGDRAIDSIAAGVDVVLFSADSTHVPEAMDAVLDRARTDETFRARVEESARRVAIAAEAFVPAGGGCACQN
ncbi:MAG: glycoside hydrolase family 3 protein [Promicromonosporaceae bacterium]|nr:glycoside hydrolase family 3 protein [Promicromonosporaceae bacterium]